MLQLAVLHTLIYYHHLIISVFAPLGGFVYSYLNAHVKVDYWMIGAVVDTRAEIFALHVCKKH